MFTFNGALQAAAETVRAMGYILESKTMAVGWVTGSAIILVDLVFQAPVGWSRWLAPGWFAMTLMLLMTIEILTCYHSSDPTERKEYPWERHIVQKLMLIGLVVISLVLDSMIVAVLIWLPLDESAMPLWGSGFLPVTLSSLIWLNTAEAIRALKNIAHTTGDSSIPPTVLWVIKQLRKIDEARLPPGVTPHKRLYDNITEDDIKAILSRMEERQLLDPPPPPLGSDGEANPKKEEG